MISTQIISSQFYSPNQQMSIKSHENLSSQLISNAQSFQNQSAKITINDKRTQKESQNLHQITYKIKDGLYLATSLDAFKDDEFILLNWIQHIVVLENENYPFDNRLKTMYGQQDDQVIEESQEFIRYLHFDDTLFKNKNFQSSGKYESFCNQKLDESLIRELHQASHQNKLAQSFVTLYEFIEDSNSFGSSCLIIPSSPMEDIDDLSCVFSVCTAYLMKKYKWSLYKALQFMNSRLKDVNLSEMTYEWLNKVQIQLLEQHTLTYNWESFQSNQELVIRNTFINTRKIICDSSLRKLDMNGQTCSRQKFKSKPQFENSFKRLSLTSINCQNPQYKLKSIIKQSDYLSPLKTQRKKIQFNTSLNLIKQYQINPKQTGNQQKSPNFECQKQNQIQKSFDSSYSSSFLSNSRNKRISLCVSKIVSKYRQQRNLSERNKSNSVDLDKFSDKYPKVMTKKQSFYNFQSCKSTANLQNKTLKNSQSQQAVKNNQSDQINKILQKIKIKQSIESTSEDGIIPIISLTEPSLCIQTQKQNKKAKLNTQNLEEIVSTQKDVKLFLENEIIRTNSLSNKSSIFQPSSSQLITNRSQQKLKKLKSQNQTKDELRTKQNHKTKQNSIDKFNGNTKLYIKEIKTQKFSENKLGIKEKIDNYQKNRQKNLMIEYQDFKEMIKKKQKSIGNLLSKHISEEKVLKENQTNALTSVIEKLKKDVSEIQLSMNQSNMIRKPSKIIQQKPKNSNNLTFQWR